jgi:hypothetical protein
MDDHRKHSRIKFEAQCLLTGHDGDTYEALLDDISLGGALIKVDDDTPFVAGDLCEVMLGDQSALFPVKHTGKIVRLDSGMIGVSFLT